MNRLDLIIPVYNEAESIEELSQRIDNILSFVRIDYKIIFVDDNSTDNTQDIIKNMALNNENISLLIKKGKKGKAYSILEGAKISGAPFIAMIDGDLQYQPEVIPAMLKICENHGVVVANRKNHKTSKLRNFGSKANILIFEKLLLGLNCDTQSGLKVFKREIIEKLSDEDVSPWTLDMPLLMMATELGYSIGTIDIDFYERKYGESKVDFSKTAFEIAISAIKLRARNGRVYPIKVDYGDPRVGTGVSYKGEQFITHTGLESKYSAITTFHPWQTTFLVVLGALILLGLGINAIYTGIIVLGILSIIYFIDLLFSLWLLIKSLHFPPEVKVSKKQLKNLNVKELPIYSILCPLYKEAKVLPHFIKAIKKLDWPKKKLDVILLFEEDDHETIAACDELSLPSYIRKVIVPNSKPKTKPKACNYGLALSKGEYVVIYDAEDRPDPEQLKKAYVAFKRLDSKVVCLQVLYLIPSFFSLSITFKPPNLG